MPDFQEQLHKSLEQDMHHLEDEIENVKSSREGQSFEKREVVKKSFESLTPEEKPEKRIDYSEQGQKRPPPKDQEPNRDFLPSYMEADEVEPETRLAVERLMDMVFHDGLLSALKESKKHPPFVQDAFHDALAEKLVPLLEDRGVI